MKMIEWKWKEKTTLMWIYLACTLEWYLHDYNYSKINTQLKQLAWKSHGYSYTINLH